MLDLLKTEANKTYTENGAATYISTKSDCLDLFATIGALRHASDEDIMFRFTRENALQLMDEEGIFSLEICIYDEFRYETERSFESLFCRYDEAISFINDIYSDMANLDLVWFEITKWRKEDGKLYEDCTYYYAQKELRYINASLSVGTFTEKMIGGGDLNLPVPFEAGDIVQIDGCNFTPRFPAVILDVGDNSDCCCLQGLARDTSFRWSSGAVKHGMIGSYRDLHPSMLYTIEKYNGFLKKEDEILINISNFIKQGSDGVRAFVEKIMCGSSFSDNELIALMCTCDKNSI